MQWGRQRVRYCRLEEVLCERKERETRRMKEAATENLVMSLRGLNGRNGTNRDVPTTKTIALSKPSLPPTP